ncbi:MAG TPA: 16S rRNA (cytidine(1402)-2'-O)-methyltransferase [Pyrinomonadaceae bacterium]|nr:16S rRNA (cytidine(1402)-2'-O)-methyltransferase [Pyrinomonadaceae bacterium]
MPGTLYLVATPIGNLQDITLRALETLRTVDVIACEDTRHTRNLLNHFRISNKTISYHEHNEQERAEEFVDRLVAGENIAIVSDAGTPGICDPGFWIVQRASEIGASVVPIPGAAAFVGGVIVSGLPTDSLFFGGFLPSKKGERRKRLEEVRDIPATLLFYEAPHRLSSSIGDCLAVLGDRKASVSRELTKLHEETVRGTLSFLFDHFQKAKVKGEIVIAIDRAGENVASAKPELSIEVIVRSYELAGLDHKAALKKAAKDLGISKSEAYRMLLPK